MQYKWTFIWFVGDANIDHNKLRAAIGPIQSHDFGKAVYETKNWNYQVENEEQYQARMKAWFKIKHITKEVKVINKKLLIINDN